MRGSFQKSPAHDTQKKLFLIVKPNFLLLSLRYYVVTGQSKAGGSRLHPVWNITLEAKFLDAMKGDQECDSPLPALHVSAREGWKHPTLADSTI